LSRESDGLHYVQLILHAGAAERRAIIGLGHAGGGLSADPAKAGARRGQGHGADFRRADERHRLWLDRAARDPGCRSGGPLAKVRNGDHIRLSVKERHIDLLVPHRHAAINKTRIALPQSDPAEMTLPRSIKGDSGSAEPPEEDMPVTLYDLAGAEPDRRFSPFCWRTKMALAHKGLEVETVPWRFTEKDKLPQPNAGRVPVLVDGGRVVHDSTAIADYLEGEYDDRPSLFGSDSGRALTRFVQNWTETVLQPALIGFVVLDICRHSAPQDQTYFRRSREERLGAALEDVVGDRQTRLPAFRDSLAPLRRTVERQKFLGGDAPLYADYIVFGAFQWARAISDFELLAGDDPIAAWRGRLLDAFGGYARRSPAYGG
jgi:glutathione S-transferase